MSGETVHGRWAAFVASISTTVKRWSSAMSATKSNRNDSEETEVAQLLIELPTKTVRMKNSYVGHLPPQRPFRLWTDIPMEERVHVQGVPGGEPGLDGGLSEVFGASMHPNKDALNKGKKSDGEDWDGKHWQNGARKDTGVLHPVVVPSSKQKKDELGLSKDRSAKKKAISAAEKGAYERYRAVQSHKTVFRPSSDAKQLEFYEDRGPKSFKTDVQSVKNKNLKDSVLQEPTSDGNLASNHAVERPKNNLGRREQASEASTSGMSGHDCPTRIEAKEEKADYELPTAMKSSGKAEDLVSLPLEHKYPRITPVKEVGDSMAIDKVDGGVEGSTRSPQEHLVNNLASTSLGVQGNLILKYSNCSISQSFVKPVIEVKREMNDDDGSKVKAIESESVADCDSDKANKLSGDCSLLKRDLEGSEVPELVQKSSSESNHVPGSAEEPKPSANVATSEEQSIQHKIVVCVGKSSSTSSSAIFSMSSIPDNSKHTDTQNSNPNVNQRIIPDNNANIRKDHAASDVPRDEDRHDIFRKAAKECPKSSVGSTSKVSNQSRISHASISKRTISESKDSMPFSSLKAYLVQNTSTNLISGESAGSLQSRSASHVQQHKTSASGFPQKSEKLNQSSTQSACKVTHASSTHPFAPSNSPTLSDEELALLLHQELNSSPRVPRVPHVQHTGSFPQLASPTATSILIKRTSSYGGKDHSLKKKTRIHLKMGRASLVSVIMRLKGLIKGYILLIGDKTLDLPWMLLLKGMTRMYLSHPPQPQTVALLLPLKLMIKICHLYAVHLGIYLMNDTGTVHGSVPRTLPGLINEIMNKGRRMTYEELCNAVLPHWPNLRKHSVECYAYSIHSQAVLDCLRNRQEWAQLVDRGPKVKSNAYVIPWHDDSLAAKVYCKVFCLTSLMSFSVLVFYAIIPKNLTTNEVESKSLESKKEEFPKGKRKARKRRRLALQGRGIKDVQRRRKTDLSDDDTGPFSNSSEESMFSENEIQGDGACPVGSEATASSDEIGAM
ncbi:hypothetical protein CRYUN_Cryun13aG0100700 [Craigia yunnanensis]